MKLFSKVCDVDNYNYFECLPRIVSYDKAVLSANTFVWWYEEKGCSCWIAIRFKEIQELTSTESIKTRYYNRLI